GVCAGGGWALVGWALILWPQEQANVALGPRLLGDRIFLANGFTWAFYNVMGKRMMRRYAPLVTTTAAGLVGTFCLVPFAAGELLAGATVQWTWAGLGAVAYTGLLVTVVGFLTLFWAYSRVQAAQVAITMYLQPLAGVLVAWALLGERLNEWFVLGAALVFIGVWVVTRKQSG